MNRTTIPNLLQSWVNTVETSFWHRQLLFAVLTIMSLGILGYHFGSFDQASHIPFLKQMANPSLYPHDTFLLNRFTKYSYFWNLFVPALRLGILEYIMFIGYLVSVYLTYVMLWRLSMTLFRSSLVAFCTVIIFSLPHVGFSFIPLFEFSLVNRIAVLPFLLLSIDWYLQKRYLQAFVLLGIVGNFHILTVMYVLAMMGLDMVLRFKEIGIKKIITSGIVFCILSFPVLFWKFTSPGTVTFAANYPWYHDLSQGLLGHLYDLWSIWPPSIFTTVGGLVMIGFTFLYLNDQKQLLYRTVIRNFLFAVCLVLLIHTLAATFYPSEFIIQFQLSRIGEFSLLFFYLFATKYVVEVMSRGKTRTQGIGLFIILLFSIIPIVYGLAEGWYRLKKMKGIAVVGLCILQGIVFLVIVGGALRLEIFKPGVYIFGRVTPSVDVQNWVRTHTSSSSMVIAPPYLWGTYDMDWRVLSERSTIATWSEILELGYNPRLYEDWTKRFDDVAPHTRNQFNGYFLQNQQIIRKAYLSLSTEHILYLKKKYDASYFVTERSVSYPFPNLYQNSLFRVYDIR